MLTVEEAQSRIVEELRPLPPEVVDLLTAARRHAVCAADVHARRDLPPFPNAAMDGYAVHSANTQGAPVTLPILRTIAAGEANPGALAPGNAARIYTGAPMPSGADCVVMQEHTQVPFPHQVLIRKPVAPGQHVRQRGEDIATGAVVLPAGSSIAPGEVGALASQGIGWLRVHRRPVVAIVPTGDELIDLDAPLPPGSIVESNSLLLAAQVEAAGAIAQRHPPVADNPDALRTAFAATARSADVVLTCGGVSVGSRDLVREVLDALGQMHFWKVAIKPGKPLAFGRIGTTPVLGLPGNPVSSFVCFELFGRPALRRLAGHVQLWRPRRLATLQQPVRGNAERRTFMRCRLQGTEMGSCLAFPHPFQGSGQQSSLLGADALIDIPAQDRTFDPGSQLPVLVLNANHWGCAHLAERL